ncbi:MAG TPA: leucine--tRNA ligase, partial [Flavobacteriaceae bacterium]|nr:leucine--tRNA ligase [Flavobacteriaceae bacterium]
MFPYPSGEGLHVGHPLGYIASDIYSRFKKLKGFNVLHPQGYDSFGLPAEQYAIQTGQHPKKTTKKNINTYRNQLNKIGFSYDWTRELRTSDPDYYKWTQFIFIELFESWYDKDQDKARSINDLISIFNNSGSQKVNATTTKNALKFSSKQWNDFNEETKEKILQDYRIAYLAESEVNWCPGLGTVLANDEIVNGVSERGGFKIEKRLMMQWNMRISSYAERLLNDLEKIDWSSSIKETQKNWIGKSIGASLKFNISGYGESIEVFTTRPDTIFGVSFMTLAPEHELALKICTNENKAAIKEYIRFASNRSEKDRISDVKKITGVFTGSYAEHPFTKRKIPIWIGDYVLASYGTGSVMSVPCGDQRDYDFAKHFNINIPNIFKGKDISSQAFVDKEDFELQNSSFLDGLSFLAATDSIISRIEKDRIGTKEINYRLRDAVFSRQRYWGEPFPIYYVNGIPKIIEKKYLPIKLPDVEKYLPTELGDPPLGRAEHWAWNEKEKKIVSNNKIDNKSIFPIELNTMPGWAGSSWYFLRYLDPKNSKQIFSKEALDYWSNVDLYIGGSEHATGHLLYSRFWTKFLSDKKIIPFDEPFKKLINQGMILGSSAIIYRLSGSNKYISKDLLKNEDIEEIHVDVNLVNFSDELDIEGLKKWQPIFEEAEFVCNNNVFVVERKTEKMSKRWYNVVNPDLICDKYGADSLRLFEMFLGPLEQYKPWNTSGIVGTFNFLKKLWKLYVDESGIKVKDIKPELENLKTLHKTINKIDRDIESYSFNTAVSNFMIAVNEFTDQNCVSSEILKPLLIILSPYVPHITEELWSLLGNKESITKESFPVFEKKYIKEENKIYPVSINGKVRAKLELSLDLSNNEIEKIIMTNENIQSKLDGLKPKRIIIVHGKIINLVT